MIRNPPANLRRMEREPAAIPISLVKRSEARQVSYEASTLDISLGGASIQTSLALVPGEWVGIVPKGEFPFAIPSRVVWVRPKDGASPYFVAGVQFIDTPVV